MQRAGRDEGVDALALRRPEGFGGAVDIAMAGPSQAADRRSGDQLGYFVDRREVAVRGDRETGLDDVDAHAFEHLGDTQLLFQVHRRAGRLLAVTQRRIENNHAARFR